jgi:hypothetical protein
MTVVDTSIVFIAESVMYKCMNILDITNNILTCKELGAESGRLWWLSVGKQKSCGQLSNKAYSQGKNIL